MPRKLMDYVLLEGPEVVIAPADTVTGYRYLGKDHLAVDTPDYAMKYLKGSLEDEDRD